MLSCLTKVAYKKHQKLKKGNAPKVEYQVSIPRYLPIGGSYLVILIQIMHHQIIREKQTTHFGPIFPFWCPNFSSMKFQALFIIPIYSQPSHHGVVVYLNIRVHLWSPSVWTTRRDGDDSFSFFLLYIFNYFQLFTTINP